MTNDTIMPGKKFLEDYITPHKAFLEKLAGSPEKKARKLVKVASLPELKLLGDIAYNLKRGRFKGLSPVQDEFFKSRAKLLKQLGDPYTYTAKQRRETLRQRGGNLSRALSRLVLSAVKCPSQNHVAEAQKAE